MARRGGRKSVPGKCSMPRKPPSIPRDALRGGTERCLNSALRYLDGAQTLLDRPTLLPHAGVLFSFAVEEFGKAVLLRRAYEEGEGILTIVGFYDHEAKLEAAAGELPLDLLMLHSGAFHADGFQADGFDVNRVANFKARMQSMYVNWDERSRTWIGPTDVDRATLISSIEGVERVVKNKLEEWVWVGA